MIYKPVRNHPLKIFDEPWIVEAHPILQIRLLHPAVLIQDVEEAS